jgi:hypothetical protein
LSNAFSDGLMELSPDVSVNLANRPSGMPALSVPRFGALFVGVIWAVRLAADSPPVQMAPVQVRSDPFRTLGIGGSVISGFHGTHAWVDSVNPASPAERAGLRPDDEIVEINGKPLTLFRVLFSFRKTVEDSLKTGSSFECGVRSSSDKTTHVLHLRAMVEPPHRWLPQSQSPGGNRDRQPPPPPPAGKLISASTWQERSAGTPPDALESLFCALGKGDVDRVASLMEVAGPGRQELLGLFASLPASGRQYYGTPEHMLAVFVDQESRPHWAQIIKTTTSAPDSAEIQTNVKFWSEYDHAQRNVSYTFHRTAAGWKWVISERSIKAYADYYRGVPFEVAPVDAVPAIAWFFHSS